MSVAAPFVVFGGLSYLLGAVPFGYLVGRIMGVDIRTMGSGNIGATNVARCFGKGWGLAVFICDALKGFLSAWVFPLAAARIFPQPDVSALAVACAIFAVAGHNWPVYLRFKGGKGIATSLGALLGIAPVCAVLGVGAWLLVFGVTRYVSAASITAAVVVAAGAWLLNPGDGILVPSALSALAAVAIWRHKSNIRRLLRGAEHRFRFRSSTDRDAVEK